MTVTITRWQFSVSDYARMRETGILSEDDRVELIDGEVRQMSPIGPRHVAIVNRLTARITPQTTSSAIMSVQNPIQLTDFSEPQPDIALLHIRPDFYAAALPRPDDVLLLIEVSDTSIEYDRIEKLPRYAAAGISEVWIIDLDQNAVEQYTSPRQNHYSTKMTYQDGDRLTSVQLPSLTIAVSDILG